MVETEIFHYPSALRFTAMDFGLGTESGAKIFLSGLSASIWSYDLQSREFKAELNVGRGTDGDLAAASDGTFYFVSEGAIYNADPKKSEAPRKILDSTGASIYGLDFLGDVLVAVENSGRVTRIDPLPQDPARWIQSEMRGAFSLLEGTWGVSF